MEHFSECILNNKEPRTPGEEGLADMRVMAAIEESAASGKAVKLAV
ncbi:MAG TPA: Gfo/Idh/MocA family oxidoreductase [Lacipirellula sp.]